MSEFQRRTAAALRDQLALMAQRQVPSNRDGFDEEFDSLRALDQRVRSNHDEFYTALLGSNMSKNRYREILPNEGTRVQLDPINSRGDGDYINANYIDGRRLFGVPFVHIATQAPLRSSIGDFWRMVFENNTIFIVMLCAEIENGKVKSERYWPDGVGGIMTVGPLTLTLTSENHRHDNIFRTINLRTADGRERDIFHMQYVRWPDQGIPQTSAPLMEIIQTLAKSNASVRTPIVVHCSGGVGRTGVFLTMHIALALYQMEMPISIPKIVQYLKFCRSGMVQRKDQYLFTYYAVLREMEKMIWAIEATRTAPPPPHLQRLQHLQGSATQVPPSSTAAMEAAPTESRPDVDGPRGVGGVGWSPMKRPVQYVSQHPAQSHYEVQRSTLQQHPSLLQSGSRSNSANPDFGGHRGGTPSIRGSGAFPGSGTVSDIELALRAAQQRTQSMRQTPTSSVQRASRMMMPTSASSTRDPFAVETKLSAVASRLPLESAAAPPMPTPTEGLAQQYRSESDGNAREPQLTSGLGLNLRPLAALGETSAATRTVSEPAQSSFLTRSMEREYGPPSPAVQPPPPPAAPTQGFFFGDGRSDESRFDGSKGSASLQPRTAAVLAPLSSTLTAFDNHGEAGATMNELEAASQSFNAALFGPAAQTANRGTKNDLSLL